MLATFKFEYQIDTSGANRTAREQAPAQRCSVLFTTTASSWQEARNNLLSDAASFIREGCRMVPGKTLLLNATDPDVVRLLSEVK